MDTVKLDLNDGLAEIVLNRPTQRNALSLAMWQRVADCVRKAEKLPTVKTILIHGGDSGVFAAGADISEFETEYATPERAEVASGIIAAAMARVEACSKPVLAAIEGPCIGGGLALALTADLRIAGPSAKFSLPPARLGLVYPTGDTRRLIAAIGIGLAKDLLFTGRHMGTDEAQACGLIQRIAAEGQAIENARQLAQKMGRLSQWSIRAGKAMVAGLQSGWSDDTQNARTLVREGFNNQDFEEGYRAFLEKRTAHFTFK